MKRCVSSSASATEDSSADATGLSRHPVRRISPSESSRREFSGRRGSPLSEPMCASGEKAAQVRVAIRVFSQKCDVVAHLGLLDARKTLSQCDFGARNRLQIGASSGVRELHRAVQTVVIGEGEGRVAQLHGSHHELFGVGRPVQKGESRVAVQLDVGDRHNVFAPLVSRVFGTLARRRPSPSCGLPTPPGARKPKISRRSAECKRDEISRGLPPGRVRPASRTPKALRDRTSPAFRRSRRRAGASMPP